MNCMVHIYLIKILFIQYFVQQQVAEAVGLVESCVERTNEVVGGNEKEKERGDHQNTQVSIHERTLKIF